MLSRGLVTAPPWRRSLAVTHHRQASLAAAAAAPQPVREGVPLPLSIGPGLQLLSQSYAVEGRQLRLVAPLDVDAVMDAYVAAARDGDPYWCRAWPSALALAAQLLRRPELVAGRRVADLGAGLGVAGMAAALAGASEVVLLDREPLALQCALLSAAASGVSSVVGLDGIRLAAFVQDAPLSAAADGMPQQQQQQVSREHGAPAAAAAAAAAAPPAPPAELLRLAQLYAAHRSAQQHPPQHMYEGGGTAAGCGGAAGAVIAEELLALLAVQAPQGQQPAPGDSSSTHSRQQHTPLHVHTKQQPGCVLYAAQQFDWSTAAGLHQAGQFDVVLAADVLYESEAVEPVAAAVRQLLPRAGGSLLLADPPARTAAHRERFVRLLAAGGSGGARGRVQFGLTECSVEDCDVALLDPEMRGGVSTSSVSVQLMLLTAHDGGDTVGVKL